MAGSGAAESVRSTASASVDCREATMFRVLVTYATTHGHTRRIAQRVADRLQDAGRHVELHELRKRGPARELTVSCGRTA